MRNILPAFLIGSALALAGCQTTSPPGTRAEEISAAAYPQVTATGNMDRFVRSDKPVVEREPNGPMTVTVPLRSTRDRETPIEYRFTFFDARGTPLRPEPTWQHLVLPSKTQQFVTGTALDDRAVDWRLELRPAR